MSCLNVFTLKATLATVKSILAPQSNSLDVVAAHKGALSLNKHLHSCTENERASVPECEVTVNTSLIYIYRVEGRVYYASSRCQAQNVSQ